MIESGRRTLTDAEAIDEGLSIDFDWVEVAYVDDEGADAGIYYESTPRPGTPAANERSIRIKIEAGIDRLEADAADAPTWAGLTAARRTETTRLAVLVVAKIARLVLRKLDKQ